MKNWGVRRGSRDGKWVHEWMNEWMKYIYYQIIIIRRRGDGGMARRSRKGGAGSLLGNFKEEKEALTGTFAIYMIWYDIRFLVMLILLLMFCIFCIDRRNCIFVCIVSRGFAIKEGWRDDVVQDFALSSSQVQYLFPLPAGRIAGKLKVSGEHWIFEEVSLD